MPVAFDFDLTNAVDFEQFGSVGGEGFGDGLEGGIGEHDVGGDVIGFCHAGPPDAEGFEDLWVRVGGAVVASSEDSFGHVNEWAAADFASGGASVSFGWFGGGDFVGVGDDVVEESGAFAAVPAAFLAGCRPGVEEVFSCPGNADVEESSFFFDGGDAGFDGVGDGEAAVCEAY